MSNRIITLLVALLLAIAGAAGWAIYRARPSSLVFHSAGLSIPLAFEGEVTRELQRVIADDLNLVYAHMTSYQMLNPIAGTSIIWQGKRVASVNYLLLDGQGRFFPKEHQDMFGTIVELDGVKMLAVPKQLVQSYEAASARQQTNQKAYAGLDVFFDRLNRLNEDPPKDANEILFFDPASRDAAIGRQRFTLQEMVQVIGNYRYEKRGLLEVREAGPDLPGLRHDLLAFYLVKVDGKWSEGVWPLIYHEGRWKYYIGNSP